MVVYRPADFTLFHSWSCDHLAYPLELCSLQRPHSHVWQWTLAIVWTTLWQCLVMIMVQVANLLKPRLKNCAISPHSIRQKRVIKTIEVRVMGKLVSPFGRKSCKESVAICNLPMSHFALGGFILRPQFPVFIEIWIRSSGCVGYEFSLRYSQSGL